MLVDTHAHLNLPPLYEHWEAVMNRSQRAGVCPIIVPGASLDTSKVAISLAQRDARIFAAVGIHPEEVTKKSYNFEFMIQELEKIAKTERVVAIGECGLDYYQRSMEGNKSRESIDAQKDLFKAQVELAQELQLPLIIHTREMKAMEDAVEILKGSLDFTRNEKPKAVFHCFSGDVAFWNLIAPMGAYVGVGATITYPKNEELRNTIKAIPLNRIVLETDAPWLPPQSKRGQTNEPLNVTISACKLAEIKQIQLSEVLESTGNNVVTLFPQLKS